MLTLEALERSNNAVELGPAKPLVWATGLEPQFDQCDRLQRVGLCTIRASCVMTCSPKASHVARSQAICLGLRVKYTCPQMHTYKSRGIRFAYSQLPNKTARVHSHDARTANPVQWPAPGHQRSPGKCALRPHRKRKASPSEARLRRICQHWQLACGLCAHRRLCLLAPLLLKVAALHVSELAHQALNLVLVLVHLHRC